MKLLIDIPESIYDTIQADEMISREQLAVLQMHILNGILHETVTEFADRCRECGAKYGKLLKQEQSGDLISRQAVLDIIHLFFTEEVDKIPTKKTEDGEVLIMCKAQPLFAMNKTLCKRIKELPSVTAEPKTGHWKRDETIRLTYCSECGFGQHIDEYRTYNYCPNCGCRMFEPQERSEKK